MTLGACTLTTGGGGGFTPMTRGFTVGACTLGTGGNGGLDPWGGFTLAGGSGGAGMPVLSGAGDTLGSAGCALPAEACSEEGPASDHVLSNKLGHTMRS